MEPKKDLIHCQMKVSLLDKPLKCNPNFSNFKPIFIDEDTLQVYDENNNFIGVAKSKLGSEILTIKLN